MYRYWLRLSVVLALFASDAQAEEPKPLKLTLTPAKLPTPALRYQLLPDARIIKSGDAAGIYGQVVELLKKKPFDKEAEFVESWNTQTLDRLPKVEMRKELSEYTGVFELLDKAACCEHCNWGLPERLREKGIGAPLEDVQTMRRCAALLGLRARLQIADGQLDKAIGSLRTGFALARHSGENETLIVFLIGAAIAAVMEKQLVEFIGQPNAPNLYYALTDLPVPLVSMRKALQGERVMVYGTFPGLAAVGADLNAGNLTDEQLTKCAKMLGSDSELSVVERTALAALILSKQETAKKALIDAGRPREKVAAMTPVQVAILHALLEYDRILDEMIVWNNLPYWELAQRHNKRMIRSGAERLKDPNVPAIPLAPLLIPAVEKVTLSRVRTDRKIALLRTIEALRFYAATHDGKLPPTLAAVKEVPIPLDPMTGKEFGYQLDGDKAILRAPAPGKETPSSANSVVYELRIRK